MYKRLRNAQNQAKPSLIFKLKSKLREREVKAAQEHYLSLRIKWMEEGEDCTKYFLNLQSKSKDTSKVFTISDEKGKTFTSNEDIIKTFTNFYQDLFKEVPVCSETQENLLTNIRLSLSDDQKSESERPFCKNDFKHALSQPPTAKVLERTVCLPNFTKLPLVMTFLRLWFLPFLQACYQIPYVKLLSNASPKKGISPFVNYGVPSTFSNLTTKF